MKILVCNAGSTSLKFKLFSMPEETILASGTIKRVGDKSGSIFQYSCKAYNFNKQLLIENYSIGIKLFLDHLTDSNHGAISNISELDAVGFKTVLSKNHYGVHILDTDAIQGMKDFISIAPAHNKYYLEAISVFQELLPTTPLVGVFETAFHQTMPEESFIYSTPYEWYEKYGIRKFGYHGASHSYVADCLTTELGNHYKAVSCHLGGSSSICAIINGKSFDTSFGMSLQCGLPQSNRSGDIDPFIIDYLIKKCDKTSDEIFKELASYGGLLGISGSSSHMIDLINKEDSDKRASLAVSIFKKELLRYIGGYAAEMGGIDAIALTAGIGENNKLIQQFVVNAFSFLGAEPAAKEILPSNLDPGTGIRIITSETSKIKVFIIPANEELGVVRKTYQKLL